MSFRYFSSSAEFLSTCFFHVHDMTSPLTSKISSPTFNFCFFYTISIIFLVGQFFFLDIHKFQTCMMSNQKKITMFLFGIYAEITKICNLLICINVIVVLLFVFKLIYCIIILIKRSIYNGLLLLIQGN